MARDANRAMNDLPTPGQHDFDMNTMKLASPTPQPKVPPAPLPPDMTQFAPMPYAEPYHSMNIPPPPDPVEAKINKLMASAPSGPDMGPPRGGVPPPLSDPAPPQAGGSSVDRMHQQQVDRIQAQIDAGHLNPDVGKKQIEAITALPTAGSGQQDDWRKWAAALGIPLAVAALLFRRGKGGGSAAELESVLGRAGGEVSKTGEAVAPHTGVTTPYADDTIAPVSDATRHSVNEADGDTKEVTQAKQDTAGRQADINSGKIKPQDYNEGEKPKPGTEGYKQWFKYRQSLSKRGAGDKGVTAKAAE
jgi:hypothetical protein